MQERERFGLAPIDEDDTDEAATLADRRVVGEQGQARIPIVEEELAVGKREVEQGAVRVHSHAVERPVEETVELREEKVSIHRQPANRPVTGADEALFQDRTIEVTETAEVPVVAKQARVVEELVVNKEVDVHAETIRDTVRETEVDVESVPGHHNTTQRRDRI